MRVAFLDEERAIEELVERVQGLLVNDERVIAVGLFGSLARGRALPSSDADLLIVLRTHPEARWIDRISEYASAFGGTALPVEVFPYTLRELTRVASRPGLIRTILREYVFLGGDEEILANLRDASHGHYDGN
ncbi:MAG: nucleotidyltransferase domain-containing protein [Chloroflexota bacterium]